MKTRIDKHQFGPWAIVTGASSGIGREFAEQIAESGINVVLVARRQRLLEEAGRDLQKNFGVQYRVLAVDLSEPGFLEIVAEATSDLDIGLIVSNAGTGNPGHFLSLNRQELQALLRLNTIPHLAIAHHFGQKLVQRQKGGLLLVGAMGGMLGNPYMANDAAAKAYVMVLGESLHYAFLKLGVKVTVLMPGPTDTPALAKFGFDPATMPMKPMSVGQCVAEGLEALTTNRPTCIPGRRNRIMLRLVPRSLVRRMVGGMFERVVAKKSRSEVGHAAARPIANH